MEHRCGSVLGLLASGVNSEKEDMRKEREKTKSKRPMESKGRERKGKKASDGLSSKPGGSCECVWHDDVSGLPP